MDNSLIVEGFNIAQLSDDELKFKLESLGFNPGPILATTRGVYERKLAKLLRNDNGEENSAIDAEVLPSPMFNSTFMNVSSASATSTPSPYRYDDLRRRPLQRVEGDSFDDGQPPVLSPYKPWSIEDITTQVPEPISDNASSFSPTFKIIIVVCIILFAFLVYYNMESNPTNPFSEKKNLGA